MPDGIRWVGLDVHARESTVALLDQATGEVMTKRVVGRPHELLPLLREIPRPARMVYEAGPTGYGLARRARAEGIEVAVCAPGKTECSSSFGASSATSNGRASFSVRASSEWSTRRSCARSS